MWHKTVLSLLCLSCFVSCTSSSPPKSLSSQEIRLNIHSDPVTLDPSKARDITSVCILKMCFDGLMRNDESGKTAPAIAEKYDISPDYKIYTFYLREAVWNDGHDVSAYDFEYAWKQFLDPLSPSDFAYDLYIIKNAKAVKENRMAKEQLGVKAINEKTLVVELEHPTPYFLDILATVSFLPLPRHIVEGNSLWASGDLSSYTSNGPFSLKSWKHHNAIALEKNSLYWDVAKVRLEKVSLLIIPDENTDLHMYENNEVDWVGSPLSSIPSDAISYLSQSKEFSYHPYAGIYYYLFNVKQYPLNNVHVRKALTLSINRAEIVDNITQTKQRPACSLIPPMMWNRSKCYFQDADGAQANLFLAKALEELGITIEQFPPITLCYNTTSGNHIIAQAIKQQWEKTLGIKVELQNKEWKVFLDELSHQQFQVARMGSVASINDPSSFLDTFRTDSAYLNYSQWTNVSFIQLLDEAENTIDKEKRLQLLADAEAILMDHMPLAPIYFTNGSYMKKTYVKGVQLSELADIDLKFAYMDAR